mmetsp:Transcript_8357/g.11641  ORF Transcript_8357/g.11641 Transcript_8357/m.11641 type:complete len:376 (-) Transcript_8357:856-1983(-)
MLNLIFRSSKKRAYDAGGSYKDESNRETEVSRGSGQRESKDNKDSTIPVIEEGLTEANNEDSPQLQKRFNIVRQNWRTLLILSYYMLGTLFFMLGPEKWGFIRSIYFLSVTITTVGYGDVTPDKDSTRLVTIIFILIGLIVIFPTLADIAVNFITHMEKYLEHLSKRANLSNHIAKTIFSVFLILGPLAVGVVYFHMRQVLNGRWNFTEALWWTIATITTIGYGDLSFTHIAETQLFLAIFIPFSTVAAGAAIANLANARTDYLNEQKERRLLETFNVETILKFDSSGDGEVDKAEYVLGMLQSMELVDPEKIRLYQEQFDLHDVDGSGALSREDLDQIALEFHAIASVTHSPRNSITSLNSPSKSSIKSNDLNV